MDSFYGGHQGPSFVIKQKFDSYAAMVEEFEKGSAYRDVWYGEYCIIDTPNKNNPDNGKIYKRGANSGKIEDSTTNKRNADAIYMGQIVGPASGLPMFEFSALNILSSYVNTELGDGEERYYPYTENNEIKYNYYSESSGSKKAITTLDGGAMQLVAGKYTENDEVKYNDQIRWTWCNIRKPTDDTNYPYEQGIVKVGFEIPYHVFEMETKTVSPYDEETHQYKDTSFAERIDNREHPFYSKYRFSIPTGIPGVQYSDMMIIKTDEFTPPIYTPYQLEMAFDNTTDRPYVKIKPYKVEVQPDQSDSETEDGDTNDSQNPSSTEEYVVGPAYDFKNDNGDSQITTALVCRLTAYDEYDNPQSSVAVDDTAVFPRLRFIPPNDNSNWYEQNDNLKEIELPENMTGSELSAQHFYTDNDQYIKYYYNDISEDDPTTSIKTWYENSSDAKNGDKVNGAVSYYEYKNSDNYDIAISESEGRVRSIWIYLGEIKLLQNITENDGVIYANYAADFDQSAIGTIRGIKNIEYDDTTGKVIVTYNTKSENIDQYDQTELGPINSLLRTHVRTVTDELNNNKQYLYMLTTLTKTGDPEWAWPENDSPENQIKKDANGNETYRFIKYKYTDPSGAEQLDSTYTGWYQYLGEIALYQGSTGSSSGVGVRVVTKTQDSDAASVSGLNNDLVEDANSPAASVAINGLYVELDGMNKNTGTMQTWWTNNFNASFVVQKDSESNGDNSETGNEGE